MADIQLSRYAHESGFVQLACDPDYLHNDGKPRLLSCGSDGDVRIWLGEDLDDEVAENFRVCENASAICWKGERFYVGNEQNEVQTFSYPEGESQSPITRLSGSVSCLDISSSGDRVLVGSRNFMIKWIDVKDYSHELYEDHKGPILSVAIHPDGTKFGSTACDGTAKIWKFGESHAKPMKTFSALFPASNDLYKEKSVAKICWSKDGELLVPTFGGLAAFKHDGVEWKNERKLKHSDRESTIFSIAAVSWDDKHVAGVTLQGEVLVWNLESGSRILKLQHHTQGPEEVICAAVWHPSVSDKIIFCDTAGWIGSIRGVFSDGKVTASQVGSVSRGRIEDESLDGLSSGNSASRQGKRILDDDDEISRMSDIGALKAKYDFALDELEGAGPSSKKEKQEPRVIQVPVDSWKPCRPQRPFICASTPETLSERYMKWNSVGIVKQYSNENENSVEVEFHDVTTHHQIVVDNEVGYTMADLSSEALALALPSSKSTQSSLYVNYFGASDPESREWTADFPLGESIEGLAIGNGWLAAVTDARIVRIFTLTGVQRCLWSSSLSVVTMAAEGKFLAIASHAAMGPEGKEQNLSLELLRVNMETASIFPIHSLVTGIPIPLTPAHLSRKKQTRGKKSGLDEMDSDNENEDEEDYIRDKKETTELSWMGFSPEGLLCIHDSCGLLKILHLRTNTWIPVCDTRQSLQRKSDTAFIVSVSELPTPKIRAILCKGSKYPITVPRPVVSVIPWSLPLCNSDNEKSQLEEKLMLTHLQMERNRDAKRDSELEDSKRSEKEAVLKLFNLAVKGEKDSRAFEVARLMPDSHSIQILIRFASRLRRIALAEKLGELARTKDREEEMRREAEILASRIPHEQYDVLDDANSAENDSGDEEEDMKPVRVKKSSLIRPKNGEEEKGMGEQEGSMETSGYGEALDLDDSAAPPPGFENRPFLAPSSGVKRNPFKKQMVIKGEEENVLESLSNGVSVGRKSSAQTETSKNDKLSALGSKTDNSKKKMSRKLPEERSSAGAKLSRFAFN